MRHPRRTRRRRRVQRSREEIERLVAAYRDSGLSQAAFAAARGVSLSTLQSWLRRSRATAVGRRVVPLERLVPVQLREATGEGGRPTGMPFVLALDNGQRLTIPSDFDEYALRRLLAVLEGPRC